MNALSHPYVRVADERRSPFIPIPMVLRVLLVLIVLIYWGVQTLATLQLAVPNALLLIAGNALVLLGYVLPLWAPRMNGYFHPVVYISLFTLLMHAIKKTGIQIHGLSTHIALPELGPYELNEVHFFVCVLFFVSQIATIGGYYLGGLLPASSLIKFRQRANSLLVPGVFLWLTIGACSLVLLVLLTGGIKEHILNLARGRSQEVYEGDSSFVGTLQVFTTFALGAACVLAATPPKIGRSLFLPFVVISAIVLEYMVSGKRSDPMMAILIIGSVWIVRRQQFSFTLVLVIVLTGFLMLSVGRLFRKANFRGQGSVSTDFLQGESASSLMNNAMTELSSRSGEGGAIYPIVYRVPGEVSMLFGQSYAEFLFRFIPRAIWKSKPNGIGRQCAWVFFGDLKGIPPGSIGEAYWNLHVPGVIGVFTCWGVFLRVLAETFLRYQTAPGMIAIYVVTLVLLRPDHNGYREWLHLIAPIVLLTFLVGLSSLGGATARQYAKVSGDAT
ncbi:hypothetical protein Enr13x_21470 [Stieleria neptunia]|uniref:Uncharacterized protein n=1 Tax=Stieleria neptunia TaxID=2527979 RepID=A0A518HN79_9BACT|nr:hypothetical protein [Stieleria neptunia]QDV42302.1 hypothetical protein Enr13x_21470 [Stieleria neptunia]